MNLARPTQERALTHEQWVEREARRMKWQRAKAAERRERRVTYYDEDTTIVAKHPPLVGCKVDGCETKHKARGYCDRHYRQWLRAGRPDDFEATP